MHDPPAGMNPAPGSASFAEAIFGLVQRVIGSLGGFDAGQQIRMIVGMHQFQPVLEPGRGLVFPVTEQITAAAAPADAIRGMVILPDAHCGGFERQAEAVLQAGIVRPEVEALTVIVIQPFDPDFLQQAGLADHALHDVARIRHRHVPHSQARHGSRRVGDGGGGRQAVDRGRHDLVDTKPAWVGFAGQQTGEIALGQNAEEDMLFDDQHVVGAGAHHHLHSVGQRRGR